MARLQKVPRDETPGSGKNPRGREQPFWNPLNLRSRDQPGAVTRSSVRSCWGVCPPVLAQSPLSLGIHSGAARSSRSPVRGKIPSTPAPRSRSRRPRKTASPRLRTSCANATGRLGRCRACAEPAGACSGPPSGLSVSRPSSDPAHWLRGGAWARSAADWTAHEQLGSRGPLEGTSAACIWTAEGCGLELPCSSAMASEKPLVAVTCTAPVNIAVIKYCECTGRGCGHGCDSLARVGWMGLWARPFL